MKEFMKDNFIVIVMAVVAIFGFSMLFYSINREYEFYEKVLEHSVEHNVDVEIEK